MSTLPRSGPISAIFKSLFGAVETPDVAAWLELPSDYGERLWGLQKGLGHKYLKRVPTGNPKRPWRYFYQVQHGRGVAHEDHFVLHAAFMHEGGHFHITHVAEDGTLTIKHDETGETKKVTKAELSAMLREHHKGAIAAHAKHAAMPLKVRRLAPGKREEAMKQHLAEQAAAKKAVEDEERKKKAAAGKTAKPAAPASGTTAGAGTGDGKKTSSGGTAKPGEGGKKTPGESGPKAGAAPGKDGGDGGQGKRRGQGAGSGGDSGLLGPATERPRSNRPARQGQEEGKSGAGGESESIPGLPNVEPPPAEEVAAAQGQAPTFTEDSADGPEKWKPPERWAKQDNVDLAPDITHPIPEHLRTFQNGNAQYQQVNDDQMYGAGQMLSAWARGHGIAIQDSPGLGKTVLGLTAMVAQGGKRNLIVIPEGGKKNLSVQWVDAADLFNIKAQRKVHPSDDGTFIASYGELYDNVVIGYKKDGKPVTEARLKPEFRNFDTIIFDESHNMANPDTARAQAGVQLQAHGQHVAYLSATPFTNIVDMHYLRHLGLYRTGPEFADWAAKAGAVVKPGASGYGDVPAKIENPSSAEPMTAIAATLLVDGRALKRGIDMSGVKTGFHVMSGGDDALPEHAQTTFRIADEVHAIAKDAGMDPTLLSAHMTNWAKAYWETLKADEAIERGKKALAEGKQVGFFTSYKEYKNSQLFGFARSLRRRAAKMRAKENHAQAHAFEMAAGRIDEKLKNLPPVINPVKKLVETFGGVGAVAEIHGGTNKDPVEEQKAFQAGTKKVVVCTMDKAGTGFSLHDIRGDAQREMINLSLPWSAAKMEQVNGRMYRVGSKSRANITYIVGDHPVERKNASRVAERAQRMGSLVDGNPGANDSAASLAAFEFGGDDDAEDIDKGLEGALDGAEGDGPAGEEGDDEPMTAGQIKKAAIQAAAADAYAHFRRVAEARKAGRDVIGEGHRERMKKKAAAADTGVRRAAAQLATVGIDVRRRSNGQYNLYGMRKHHKASAGRIAGIRGATADGHDQVVKLAEKLAVHDVKVTPLTVDEIGGSVRPRDIPGYIPPDPPPIGTKVTHTGGRWNGEASIVSHDGSGEVTVERPSTGGYYYGPIRHSAHVDDIEVAGTAKPAAGAEAPAPKPGPLGTAFGQQPTPSAPVAPPPTPKTTAPSAPALPAGHHAVGAKVKPTPAAQELLEDMGHGGNWTGTVTGHDGEKHHVEYTHPDTGAKATVPLRPKHLEAAAGATQPPPVVPPISTVGKPQLPPTAPSPAHHQSAADKGLRLHPMGTTHTFITGNTRQHYEDIKRKAPGARFDDHAQHGKGWRIGNEHLNAVFGGGTSPGLYRGPFGAIIGDLLKSAAQPRKVA